MSHVIGLPLLKGNSNVMVAGALKEGVPVGDWFTGQAVSNTGLFGGLIPVIVALDDVAATGFYGFLAEINECSGKASVVRAAESVCLPSDGSISGVSQVLVDSATGLISATGDIAISGTIVDDGAGSLSAKNGQTGEVVVDPVIILLSVSPLYEVVPPVAAAAKSKTA